MRVVIVGAGLVGTQLAQHLIREKHDVSLIESNEERVRHISNRLDCLVLHDEGNSLSVLEEAGISKADALVCVTSSDEVNMIICGIAECRYPDLLKIVRVHNDDYFRLNSLDSSGENKGFIFETPQILGIDYFVHPDVEAARAALNAVEHGAIGGVISFSGTDYELGSIEVAEGSKFDSLALKDYRKLITGETLITMIERGGKSILPDGSTVITAGDCVHILAKEDELNRVFEYCGGTNHNLHNIGIVGGAQIGTLIAEGLLSSGGKDQNLIKQFTKKAKSAISFLKGVIRKTNRRVLIVENDYERCKELSSHFPGVLVLNEDISDETFIQEERINDLDLIITATGHQELNIVTALYLKARGVKRAIAFVSGDGYATIARSLGIDVVIPIKSAVVDAILSRLSGHGVRGIHRIGNESTGIFEIEINPDTLLAGKKITEFHLTNGGLLMLVSRNGESFIPRGDYVFNSGDHIIIIAKNGSEKEIEKYFGVSL